jgi:hypothetical protein
VQSPDEADQIMRQAYALLRSKYVIREVELADELSEKGGRAFIPLFLRENLSLRLQRNSFRKPPSGLMDWTESTSIAASTSALIFLRRRISWVESARRRTRHSHGWSAISGWWMLSNPDW